MISLVKNLQNRHLILASGSPRRQQFIKDLGLDFEVRLKKVDEVYPENLKTHEVAEFLAKLKAKAYLDELEPRDILITGDTIVCYQNNILGKPQSKDEAIKMLEKLSGKAHEVISSAHLQSTEKAVTLHDKTKVYFKNLEEDEILFYIDKFKPFDKAGAYGIQEWIGKIGIEKIEGSFYNVMGMPINKVYEVLKSF